MATALVVGNMVGSGVFLLPASLAPYGWNSVAAWVITTAGATILAIVIGALIRAHPRGGGPVGIVNTAFGAEVATLIGWSAWVSYWAAVATVAVAAVSYLSVFVPALAASRALAAITALMLIAALTLLNLRGARAAGHFQLASTIVKLMPLVAVIIVLAARMPAGRLPVAPFPATGLDLSAMTAAATLTLWALVGFEAAGLASDAVDNPETTIPRATIGGTAFTGLVYIIVCSGIVLTLPAATLAASNAPFALFLSTYWSADAGAIVAAFAAISCLGALNGFVLIQGEIPLGMAKAGLLPGWFGATDQHGTPIRMLVASSILAGGLVLSTASGTLGHIFTFMALLSTSATLWLYLALALAAVRLGIIRAIAGVGGLYALWTLWGAGLSVSALSLALMLTVVPIRLWMRRSAEQTA